MLLVLFKNMVPLEKKEATEVINFGFPRKEKFTSSKKTFIGFKYSTDRKSALFNILARLIDQYAVFTYTETMLRNNP